jgi:7-cyano-7-deazaguanine synthase
MQNKAVISVSGGMDSTSLLLRLIREDYDVTAISFDYGQKHIIELHRLKKNLEYLKSKGYNVSYKKIDLKSITSSFTSSLTSKDIDVPEGFYEEESMKQTVVPNRNAMFSSIAYGIALSIANENRQEVKLALGVHSGDHAIYPDCRPEFYEKLFDCFSTGNWDGHLVKPYLPYIDGDKTTILQDALISCEKLKLNFDEIFKNTNTSYAPDIKGRSSGKTGSDIERILAFHEIGRKDPVRYKESWEQVLSNALKVQKEFREKSNDKQL